MSQTWGFFVFALQRSSELGSDVARNAAASTSQDRAIIEPFRQSTLKVRACATDERLRREAAKKARSARRD